MPIPKETRIFSIFELNFKLNKAALTECQNYLKKVTDEPLQ